MSAAPNTSTNYAGRSLDLLIFQGFDPRTATQVELAISDDEGDGYVCAGIQKVAQEFTILFLTDIGSNPWDIYRGTGFMPNLRQGFIQDETSLQTHYEFAVLDIFDYLEKKVLETTPDDEILASAELVSFDLRPGFISLQVKVTSLAGDSRVFIIPVQTVI